MFASILVNIGVISLFLSCISSSAEERLFLHCNPMPRTTNKKERKRKETKKKVQGSTRRKKERVCDPAVGRRGAHCNCEPDPAMHASSLTPDNRSCPSRCTRMRSPSGIVMTLPRVLHRNYKNCGFLSSGSKSDSPRDPSLLPQGYCPSLLCLLCAPPSLLSLS